MWVINYASCGYIASPDRMIKDLKSASSAGSASKEIKDDPRMPSNGSDSYTPPPSRYTEWRDRDRDRERRYRDDDHRWRDRDKYVNTLHFYFRGVAY